MFRRPVLRYNTQFNACKAAVIPIQKNNLTSLSRLAVLSVLSAARRLVNLLFEGISRILESDV